LEGFTLEIIRLIYHLTSDLNEVEMEKDKTVFYNQNITSKKKHIMFIQEFVNKL